MAKKNKKQKKDKKSELAELYLVELDSHYGSSSEESRAFRKRKEAEKYAESWVGNHQARKAHLSVFNAKGKKENVLTFGPRHMTEFVWSQPRD